MKKITSICLVFFTAFMLFVGVAFAKAEYDGPLEPYAVMLIDANSGEVLCEKNADKEIHPASTTKILTCILTIEKSDMDEKVLVSQNAANEVREGSSYIGLGNGEKVRMEDLLIGMMMKSGNDGAVAVAEHVAESESAFVDMMNEKAKEIGMTSSHFVNPHGKDDDEHITTAADMAKLAQYAMQDPEFRKIVDRASYEMPGTNQSGSRTCDNTNYLMNSDDSRYYRYATGIKTGSTPEADGCLVASATKNDTDLICLIFGDDSTHGAERWPLAQKLFDWGFEKFTAVDLSALIENIDPIQVTVENVAANDPQGGVLEFLQPVLDDPYITIDKDIAEGLLNGSDTVEPVTTVPLPLEAPILEGEIVGSVTYRSKETGEILCTGDLIAARDVLEAGTETGANGGTAVATLPPTVPEEIVTEKDNSGIFWWLLIPAGLIGFLVFRLITVNKRKRRRYVRKRKPHYSYKVRK